MQSIGSLDHDVAIGRPGAEGPLIDLPGVLDLVRPVVGRGAEERRAARGRAQASSSSPASPRRGPSFRSSCALVSICADLRGSGEAEVAEEAEVALARPGVVRLGDRLDSAGRDVEGEAERAERAGEVDRRDAGAEELADDRPEHAGERGGDRRRAVGDEEVVRDRPVGDRDRPEDELDAGRAPLDVQRDGEVGGEREARGCTGPRSRRRSRARSSAARC